MPILFLELERTASGCWLPAAGESRIGWKLLLTNRKKKDTRLALFAKPALLPPFIDLRRLYTRPLPSSSTLLIPVCEARSSSALYRPSKAVHSPSTLFLYPPHSRCEARSLISQNILTIIHSFSSSMHPIFFNLETMAPGFRPKCFAIWGIGRPRWNNAFNSLSLSSVQAS